MALGHSLLLVALRVQKGKTSTVPIRSEDSNVRKTLICVSAGNDLEVLPTSGFGPLGQSLPLDARALVRFGRRREDAVSTRATA